MKKKIFFWILGIIGIMIIAGGVYAYNVYSTVSKTLDTVHKPLNRKILKRETRKLRLVKISLSLF